ncbi:MAG TPA: surface lipoprotein assembly modifier [Woeseiaceae bacterium]
MRIRTIASALCLLAGSIAAAAPGERIDFSGGAATGVEYDSNVSMLDLDQNTGRGDTALLTNLGLGADVTLTQAIELKLGYDLSQTRYRDLSDFDLSMHQISAGLKYDAGAFDAGLSLHHVAAELGGEDFLTMRRVSPSVAKLFGERLYLRGAYVRTAKEHQADTGRSAVNHGLSADAFLFLDGPQRYVALGWTTADEDADIDDFDYDGYRLKLTYAQRLERPTLDIGFKARLQLERRDYRQILESSSLVPTAPRNRSDERVRAALLVDVPVTEWLAVEGAIERASNTSNLVSADFDEMSYSVRLAAEF